MGNDKEWSVSGFVHVSLSLYIYFVVLRINSGPVHVRYTLYH